MRAFAGAAISFATRAGRERLHGNGRFREGAACRDSGERETPGATRHLKSYNDRWVPFHGGSSLKNWNEGERNCERAPGPGQERNTAKN
jgi:hypothetical protein